MPTWRHYSTVQYQGVEIVIQERLDKRNRLGAIEYIFTAKIDGHTVLSDRIDQSKFLGHCYGQLLIPQLAAMARQQQRRLQSSGQVNEGESSHSRS